MAKVNFSEIKNAIKDLNASYKVKAFEYQDSKSTLGYFVEREIRGEDFSKEEVSNIFDKIKSLYPNNDLKVSSFDQMSIKGLNIVQIQICRNEGHSFHQFNIKKGDYKGIVVEVENEPNNGASDFFCKKNI